MSPAQLNLFLLSIIARSEVGSACWPSPIPPQFQGFAVRNSVGCGVQTASWQPDLKQSRIINGVDAKPNSWPWMASLMQRSHFCGATLLRVRDGVESSDIVLTAAHCVIHNVASSITVVLGKHKQSTPGAYEQKRQASEIRVHPHYGLTSLISNDVALVKLASPVQFSDVIRPLCLPVQDAPIPSGQTCVTIGWGVTATGSLADALQQLVLPVHSASTCESSWQAKYDETHMICAGSLQADSGICFGDSGSMLACKQSDNRWVQFGISSFVGSRDCLEHNIPAVFARVSSYIDWINQNMKDMTSL